MRDFASNFLARGLLICAFIMAPAVLADTQDPQKLVEKVTRDLLTLAKEANGGAARQEQFFTDVEKILDEVVDFRFIARSVMGNAFNNATPEQRKAFADAFKGGLVRSYAKGISGYANSDIKVVGATINPQDANRAVVRQEVTYEGNIHQLSYAMRKQGGEWKLINVILNGVNLGQSFSSQFTAAMRKEGNDIDKVIANWLAES